MKTKLEKLQLKFMEYIFFLQEMPTVQVTMESQGFRATNPQTHSHFKYKYPEGYNETSSMEEEVRHLKDFILDAHNYAEANVDYMTHEELKRLKMKSFDFLSGPGKECKVLQSQAQRDKYLAKIAEFKSLI